MNVLRQKWFIHDCVFIVPLFILFEDAGQVYVFDSIYFAIRYFLATFGFRPYFEFLNFRVIDYIKQIGRFEFLNKIQGSFSFSHHQQNFTREILFTLFECYEN